MRTDELIAADARTRLIAGAEQVEPSCLAAGKRLAGLRTWTICGCFRCVRHGQGRGPGNAVNLGRAACYGGVGGPAVAAHHQAGLQTAAGAAR